MTHVVLRELAKNNISFEENVFEANMRQTCLFVLMDNLPWQLIHSLVMMKLYVAANNHLI